MSGKYVRMVESLIKEKEDAQAVDKRQKMIDYVESERSKGNMGYIPGLTATSRVKKGVAKVSSIAAVIAKKELIPEGSRILHAGAGRPNNPDREYLDSIGDAYHYDPGQPESNNRGPIGKGDFDAVVSPFVLNVLSTDDRKMPIKDMLTSLKPDGIAIVGVRGIGDVIPATEENAERKPNWARWDDGWLVPKSGKITFQKGFSAKELQEYMSKYFKEVKIVNKSSSVPVVVGIGPRK